jgi:hypothetical protein
MLQFVLAALLATSTLAAPSAPVQWREFFLAVLNNIHVKECSACLEYPL